MVRLGEQRPAGFDQMNYNRYPTENVIDQKPVDVDQEKFRWFGKMVRLGSKDQLVFDQMNNDRYPTENVIDQRPIDVDQVGEKRLADHVKSKGFIITVIMITINLRVGAIAFLWIF